MLGMCRCLTKSCIWLNGNGEKGNPMVQTLEGSGDKIKIK